MQPFFRQVINKRNDKRMRARAMILIKCSGHKWAGDACECMFTCKSLDFVSTGTIKSVLRRMKQITLESQVNHNEKDTWYFLTTWLVIRIIGNKRIIIYCCCWCLRHRWEYRETIDHMHVDLPDEAAYIDSLNDELKIWSTWRTRATTDTESESESEM